MSHLGASHDFVSVSIAGMIVVCVAEREKFDAIALQARDHGIQADGRRMSTKQIEQCGLVVVFGHWDATEDVV